MSPDDAGRRIRRVSAGLVWIGLVAGCAASATAPPPVTPTSTTAPTTMVTPAGHTAASPAGPPAATPTPTATATPSSVAWGPAVLVTGWETCRVDTGPYEWDPDGITMHTRGGTVSCTDEANDPRISGQVTGTVEFDFWGQGVGDGALIEWGKLHLENDGGAWDGRYAGAYTSETGDIIPIWYTGTGGYAGLSYFQWVNPAPGTVMSGTVYRGLIFPGSPPAP